MQEQQTTLLTRAWQGIAKTFSIFGIFEKAIVDTGRPLVSDLSTIFGHTNDESEIKIPRPRTANSFLDLLWMYEDLYPLRQVIDKIPQEVLRGGVEKANWEAKFSAKCKNCGDIYKNDIPDECVTCGWTEFDYPDAKQKDRFNRFIKRANINGQSLFELLDVWDHDFNITDDTWVLLLKDYVLTEDGEIFAGIPREILRGDPETFRYIADRYNRPGGKYYKCLVSGCKHFVEETDREKAKTLRCPEHDTKLHDVLYVALDPYGKNKPTALYVEGEVCHKKKFRKQFGYGHSPIITLYPICETLIALLNHVRDTYVLERSPSGGLFITTDNPDSFLMIWDEAKKKKIENPNYFPAIPLEGQGSGGSVQYVSFISPEVELKYLEMMDEFRRGISAQYGVSLIFQNDISVSGGLNNEGLQITVSNRAQEIDRSILQELVDFITDQFNITDWQYVLPSVEERDEMAEKQRFGLDIQNAQGMIALGYVPTLDPESQGFVYEYNPDKAKELSGAGDIIMANPLQERPQLMSGEPASMHKFEKGLSDCIDHDDALLIKAYFDEVWAAIHKEDALWDTYAGLTETQSDTVNSILENHFTRKSISLKEIMGDLTETVGIDEAQARNIARTEMSAVVNKARELDWNERDPEGGWKYKWVGPDDNRTSEVCSIIKRRTAGGVSLKELKTIVKEEAIRYAGKSKSKYKSRDLVPHISCRHTAIRVF